MASIYGDNVRILDRIGGLCSFQIDIHMETEESFTLSAELNSTDENHRSQYDFSYAFQVQHLPPIVVTFLLPRAYPSHLPPRFTIFSQWLNSNKISNLCSVLDSMWKEQPGQEVIFHWVEWLKSSSLSYLGFEKEIPLSPYEDGVTSVGDRLAISGSISVDVDISSIRTYHDEKCHDKFLKDLHECCICFGEYPGTN